MLADTLKVLLATSYVFAIKAQNFHWNVEGPDFPQYHVLFGNIYEEVADNCIDQLAENVRKLGSYTPGSMARFVELSGIAEQVRVPRAELMLSELLADNTKLLDMWKDSFRIAEQDNEQGIANFIAERIDAHAKHGWFLRSTLNKIRA